MFVATTNVTPTNIVMSIKEKVLDLNQMVLQGQIVEAFDKYYAQNVVMEEAGSKREGFDVCRQFEVDFVNSLTEFRGAAVKSVAVDEQSGVAMIEWWFDYSHKEWGDINALQVARQQWEDGKIVSETFFKLN